MHHAGPSAHNAPVQRRLIGVFGCTSALNAGSIVSTSGSLKYVVGGASGPKSRGGLEMTVGADSGVPWRACAAIDLWAIRTEPAAAPTVDRNPRLVL